MDGPKGATQVSSTLLRLMEVIFGASTLPRLMVVGGDDYEGEWASTLPGLMVVGKRGVGGGGMFGVWVKSGYMKKGCMGAEYLKGAIKQPGDMVTDRQAYNFI